MASTVTLAPAWKIPPPEVVPPAGGFDDVVMPTGGGPAKLAVTPRCCVMLTLHVPTPLLWRTVAERVIAALEQAPLQLATEVEVELVVRESTGPAPGLRRV